MQTEINYKLNICYAMPSLIKVLRCIVIMLVLGENDGFVMCFIVSL